MLVIWQLGMPFDQCFQSTSQKLSKYLLADAALGHAGTPFSPGHLHLGALVQSLLGNRQGGVPQHKALGAMRGAILRNHLNLLHTC